MSFDAILGLLAVVFFVVLPLISNASKRKPPEQGGQGGDLPGVGRPQPSAGGGQPEPQLTGWAAKLEEARRRIEAELADTDATVRPAQSRSANAPASAGPAAPQGATLRQAPQAAQVAQAGRPSARPGRAQPEPSRIRQPAQTTGPVRVRQAAQRAAPLTDLTVASEELQVTRLGRSGHYNDHRSARKLPALTSRESVLNGIIWHQILSEPPSKTRTRRQTSRLRSP